MPDKMLDNSVVMVFGDLHAPYHHPQALDFLRMVKTNYNPTRVFNLGDELDSHSLSFYPHRPDLANATSELKASRKVMKELEDIFPVLYNCESNHTSRLYRVGLNAGIPKELLLPYKEMLGIKSDKWYWKPEYRIRLVPDKSHITFIHNGGGNALLTSQRYGCSLVAGHHHTLFNINYWQSPTGVNFSGQCGSLIDISSPAFAYTAGQTLRPLLGCLIIERGIPRLIQMKLNKNNTWMKEIN